MSKIEAIIIALSVLLIDCVIESTIYYFLWNNVITYLFKNVEYMDAYRAVGMWFILTLIGKNFGINILKKGDFYDNR